MANALRCEAEFTVGDRTYNVRYSWNAAAEFEEVTGRPVSDAFFDIARDKLHARTLRGMLWAGLQERHPDVTLKEAGRLIDQMGRREAQRVLGVALRYFFPEIQEVEERLARQASDPPKPAGGP